MHGVANILQGVAVILSSMADTAFELDFSDRSSELHIIFAHDCIL